MQIAQSTYGTVHDFASAAKISINNFAAIFRMRVPAAFHALSRLPLRPGAAIQCRSSARFAVRGMVVIALLLSAAGEASAFHEGGVGPCEACHTMHNTAEGVPLGVKQAYLLRGQDPSSICLNCHQQAFDVGPAREHISTPENELQGTAAPKQLTPGGDFGWLKKSYSWYPGQSLPLSYSPGERHGHNIVAADFLYGADSVPVAPGGTYPSAGLACTSCHDPHGRYRRHSDGAIGTTGKQIADSGSYASSPDPNLNGSVGVYRLLAGVNYQPKSVTGNFAFLYDPPDAVAPGAGAGDSNRAEATTQTRVAYGRGMSEWCRNCHPGMHNPAYSGLHHAAGATGSPYSEVLGQIQSGQPYTYADNYNRYIKTGNLLGTSNSSYLSLVPFEEGTGNYALLKQHARTDDSYLNGPDNVDAQVMCLTCHRAHASGWDSALRWNSKTEYIVYDGLYSQETASYEPYGQGRAEAEALRAYYEQPASKFAMNQKTLCDKCHVEVYP